MEMILTFLMNKFGLAAVIGALGVLAYIYRSVKSNVAIYREQTARQAAEEQAKAARIQAQEEINKRLHAERTASIEQYRNVALTAELKAEREQKTREENINEQESSDLVADALDHLFDMPDDGLPGATTGSDADVDDA